MKGTVTGRKILIVDGDEKIMRELSEYFGRRGNTVFTAGGLSAAAMSIHANAFDAIILDTALPDGDGLQLFSTCSSLPPTIVLSKLDGDSDVLAAFEAGACDYAVKPYSPRLLEARLALRIYPQNDAAVTRYGLTLDHDKRRAVYNGAEIHFTYSEFNILYFLMTHAGIYYNATQIYENVWRAPMLKTTTIKYHISNMRKKLQTATGEQLILTAFGKGYAFITGGEGDIPPPTRRINETQ